MVIRCELVVVENSKPQTIGWFVRPLVYTISHYTIYYLNMNRRALQYPILTKLPKFTDILTIFCGNFAQNCHCTTNNSKICEKNSDGDDRRHNSDVLDDVFAFCVKP